jgi:hypothetical protein
MGHLHSFGETRRSISTFADLLAKPAFAETLGIRRQGLWQARASADTLFAFILVLPDGAFCEGG